MKFGTNRKKYVATYSQERLTGGMIYKISDEIIAESDSFNGLLFDKGVATLANQVFYDGVRNDPSVVEKVVNSDTGQCVLAQYVSGYTVHTIVIDRNLSLGE